MYIGNRRHQATISSRGLRENPGWKDFVRDTMEKLVESADGMFILVSLQLDMLLGLHSLLEMRKALEVISTKVDDFYAATLSRIKASNSDTPLKILAWLVKGKVLHIDILQFQEAIALQESQGPVNPDALIPIDDIAPMCCGLIILDDSSYVSLAHATAHKYLSRNLDMAKDFEHVIHRTCVEFMNTSEFLEIVEKSESSTLAVITPFHCCNKDHPFMQYAYYHIRSRYNSGCPSKDPKELVAYSFSINQYYGSFMLDSLHYTTTLVH